MPVLVSTAGYILMSLNVSFSPLPDRLSCSGGVVVLGTCIILPVSGIHAKQRFHQVKVTDVLSLCLVPRCSTVYIVLVIAYVVSFYGQCLYECLLVVLCTVLFLFSLRMTAEHGQCVITCVNHLLL